MTKETTYPATPWQNALLVAAIRLNNQIEALEKGEPLGALRAAIAKATATTF
jgi:hypothetical protein